MRIQLLSDNGSNGLKLDCNQDGWCTVLALTGSGDVKIGSEDFLTLSQKIQVALTPQPQTDISNIDDLPWNFITTLSEDHGAIYTKADDQRRRFLLQDKDGNPVSEFSIGPSELNIWHPRIVIGQIFMTLNPFLKRIPVPQIDIESAVFMLPSEASRFRGEYPPETMPPPTTYTAAEIEDLIADWVNGGPDWIHANLTRDKTGKRPDIIDLDFGKKVGNPSPSINVSH